MTSYGGATTAPRSPVTLGVEPEGAERADLGHGVLERRGGRARAARPPRTGVGRSASYDRRRRSATGRHPSNRHSGGRRATFPAAERVVAPTIPTQPESPCPARATRHARCCASPAAILVLLGLLPVAAGPRRGGRGRPDDDRPRAAPGPRPGRARGSPSPSTSRTPVPPSTASSGSPAAPTRGPGSRRRSSSRPGRASSTSCTPCRRRSAAT